MRPSAACASPWGRSSFKRADSRSRLFNPLRTSCVCWRMKAATRPHETSGSSILINESHFLRHSHSLTRESRRIQANANKTEISREAILREVNVNPSFDPFAVDYWSAGKNRQEVVAMLHELYAAYPQENHAILAQALLQARKNVDPGEGYEAIQKE